MYIGKTMCICVCVCVCVCVCAPSLQSCLTVCDPMDCVAHQAPLSMGFSRQEYWSGLPCPPPGDLSDPGIELASPVSPALQADSLPLSHQGSQVYIYCRYWSKSPLSLRIFKIKVLSQLDSIHPYKSALVCPIPP